MKHLKCLALFLSVGALLTGCGSSPVSEAVTESGATEDAVTEETDVSSRGYVYFDNFDDLTVSGKGFETAKLSYDEMGDCSALSDLGADLSDDAITFKSSETTNADAVKYLGMDFDEQSYSISGDDFDTIALNQTSVKMSGVTGMYAISMTYFETPVLDETHTVAMMSVTGDVVEGESNEIALSWNDGKVSVISDCSGTATLSVSVVDSETGAYDCYMTDISLNENYVISYADIVANLPKPVE